MLTYVDLIDVMLCLAVSEKFSMKYDVVINPWRNKYKQVILFRKIPSY